MAEARTDEEEEGGLETSEEPVVRRQPRPGAGGDRPNRRKPEHRHSQGPLSSIRAVLKRTTTRSTSVSEGPRERERERVQDRERDRRRPEITILSAEPLSSTSWFPGASGGFPPPPPPASQIWTPTIPPTIKPPPSYEEVIREKSQEQVLLPPPASSLPPPSSSSCLRTVSTVTSATQTDLGPAPPDPKCAAVLRRPSRPPRPSFPTPPRPLSHVDDLISTDAGQSPLRPARTHGRTRPRSLVTSASCSQTDQWEPLSVVAPPPPSNPSPLAPVERPRPRPRSRLIERPVGADVQVQTLVKLRADGQATLAALGRGGDAADQEVSQGKYLQELLEAFSADDWGFPEDRRGDSGPSQSESEEEDEEEEGDMAKLKARIDAFQPEQPPLSDSCHGDVGPAGSTAAPTRPEPRPRLQGQPAKPAPPAIAPKPKPQCKEFWEDGLSPTPVSEKPSPSGSPAPKPSPRPRPAPRASLGTTAPPRPPSLPGTRTEREAQAPGKTSSTPTTGDSTTTTDTVKTGSDRPAVPGKPSSLTSMSSRRASAPSLGLKPTVSPTPPALGVKPPTLPAAPQAPTQRRISSGPPPRPSGVKALPLRPPPIKTVPGRPPPPTVNPTSSSVANQTPPSRTKPAPSASSAIQQPSSLQESPAPSSVPANHKHGQKALKKGPPLPPRPKPGHPLYVSYMQKQEVLIVLDNHGSTPPIPQLITEQSVDQSTCLLDIQQEVLPGPDSQSKVVSEEFGISDIQSSLMVQPSKQKDPEVSPPISGPRCVARCDYDGQEEDELTFSQGDVIALSELIGQEWGRGQIHGRTGIFPLSFTQVLEPLPSPLPKATTEAISLTKDVTLLENTEPTSSESPVVTEKQQEKQEEWALAVFNFPGQTVDDLSFQQGALIRVLQHVDSDWRRGRVEDREGLYPVAFTEPYTGGDYKGQPNQDQPPPGSRVAKALFDFTAESQDELTLKIGDVLSEVESLDELWIIGVVGGRRGMVPKNYISLL
ncbi:SH3 domain-containing protein 19 isoform X1 [Gadus morhua]|uniref:SH3 domain-containing protein 19 isoform X1 n=1 Tax=Gadus morhua TaxID=8049 RepID=UPI0011B6C08E|nr:SH3 domain-containing protein 19-like isoform X1 [Gadus morhua]